MPAPWLVITGLDGAGKTTLVRRVAERFGAFAFRLPYHDFVYPALEVSGGGTPFGDVYTDRLIFATDARLTNALIRKWEKEHKALVSQRGWMDNFVFGAVQGMPWKETDRLLAPRDLTRPAGFLCLVADPEVAWARVRPADKYETPEFIIKQHTETLRLMAGVESDPSLQAFRGIRSRIVDTTRLTPGDVWADVEPFVEKTFREAGPLPAPRETPPAG